MLTCCVRSSLALGCAIAFSFGLHAAAQSFTITEIGELPNHYGSTSGGINQAGQVVGTAPLVDDDNLSDAFLYSDGQTTNLGNTPGGDQTVAAAINNRGQITGYDFMGRNPQGYLYSNGVFTVFPIASGSVANYAFGLNNTGQVTGVNDLANGTSQAFIYDKGAFSNLGTFPGGTFTSGSGINDFAEVTGYGDNASGSTHAFLYHKGTFLDLGILPGGTTSSGAAINNLSMITGNADNASGSTHAFLWLLGHMIDLGIPNNGRYGEGSAINLFGDVVGSYQNSDGSAQYAFLYSDGAIRNLNSLIPSDSPWILISATGINDKGQIAATGLSKIPDGPLGFPPPTHSFLLTPVCTDHDWRSHKKECFCDQPRSLNHLFKDNDH